MYKQLFRQKSCIILSSLVLKNLHSNVSHKMSIVQRDVQKYGLLWPVLKNLSFQIRSFAGEIGSGAGRGGGAGGSIRESGGGLGKMGAANEEGYFHNKGKEQLKTLKKKVKREPGKKSDKGKNE